MPKTTGQGMEGTTITLAQLKQLAQKVDDCVSFDDDGELSIDDMDYFVLVVRRLTEAILS